jgi:hypothetical protein
MNAKLSGDVTAKFTDYTRKANRDLIERSFNGTDFIRYVPGVVRDQLAAYPEAFGCNANETKTRATTGSMWQAAILSVAQILVMLFT